MKKTPREERYCVHCKSRNIFVVEDEVHFLVACPFTEDRIAMLESICDKFPSESYWMKNHGIGHAEGCQEIEDGGGKVWFIYDDKRFKQTLRVSRAKFELILARIRPHFQRQTVTEEEELISPEVRLAICLNCLGRGDYLYSIISFISYISAFFDF